MTAPQFIPKRQALGPSFQASQWQKCPVLLDIDEMKILIKEINSFEIVQVGGLIEEGKEIVPLEHFLMIYEEYIKNLKNGDILKDEKKLSFFSTIWTTTFEALYCVNIKPGFSLIRVEQPVVQLQHHRFDYSEADGKFRSMVLGVDSIQWGIMFSFPHLFQNAQMEIFTVREGPQFPNALLFKKIQKWVRNNTVPTTFNVEDKQVNVPIRLGKQCKIWVNSHPQLIKKKLKVI